MARTDFDMQVAGLKELVVGLRTMQGPKLGSVIGDSLNRTTRGVVIPAMRRQMASDFKKKGSHVHGKVKPGRGADGPAARNVTARRVRRRSGELVAVGVGPRAWWSHFPIAGTRAHSLGAKRAGRSSFSVLPFAPNVAAGRKARKAMGFRVNMVGAAADGWGTWETKKGGALRGISLSGAAGPAQARGMVRANAGIRHPGTRGTDSIRKAVQGVTGQLNERYARDLQAAYDKHISRPTRSAKPKP